MSTLKDRQTAPHIPDLTRPSLRALSWLLRHPSHWPTGFRWDYTHCDRCALGLAVARWPHAFAEYDAKTFAIYGEGSRVFDAACDILGIDHTAAGWIFFVAWHRPLDSLRMEDVTPDHVADAIDRHLARCQ